MIGILEEPGGFPVSSRFVFRPTSIDGLSIAERKPIVHELGSFTRFFCSEEFREIGFSKGIAQINHSLTRRKGSVRGMHFQYFPHAEIKIVTCLKGKIFDVAIDLRRGSPTFLRWHAEVLSEENRRSLCIPEGFAHGFQTLRDDCELLYLHSAAYAPQAEGGVHGLDPQVGISWPLPVTEMSARDNSHVFLDNGFAGLQV